MPATTDAQVGDMVEIVYRGVVHSTPLPGSLLTENGSFNLRHPDLAEVRVVQRAKKEFKVGDEVREGDYDLLPRGAVVIRNRDLPVAKGNDGIWFAVRGPVNDVHSTPRKIVYLP